MFYQYSQHMLIINTNIIISSDLPFYGRCHLTSIINFNYSIPFSIFHNTTKRKELFSLKGTTFVYALQRTSFVHKELHWT
jgi:hypothetical protein